MLLLTCLYHHAYTTMSMLPCLYYHVNTTMPILHAYTTMSIPPCLYYYDNNTLPILPCQYYHVNTTMSILPYQYYHVNITMSILPCPYFHVNTTMSILPCQYYYTNTTITILPWQSTHMVQQNWYASSTGLVRLHFKICLLNLVLSEMRYVFYQSVFSSLFLFISLSKKWLLRWINMEVFLNHKKSKKIFLAIQKII